MNKKIKSDPRVAIMDRDTAKEILDLLEIRPKADKVNISVFEDGKSFFTMAGREDVFVLVRFDTKANALEFAGALANIFECDL